MMAMLLQHTKYHPIYRLILSFNVRSNANRSWLTYVASEEDRSNKPVRRRFSLRNESLNESSDQSNVPTGLQMFSAYRKGILNPDIVNTQPSASTSKVAEQSSAKITEPRIPATWLKPRGALSRLLNGHVPPVTSDPSTSNLASLNSQKIPYDPQTTPTKSGPPTNSKKLLVSSRQRGNPLLELIRHVVWEYAEIGPDYVFGPSQCGFFLSLRYHNINPGYIFERLQKLTSNYQLIVLIVLVDVDDAHHPLKELNKFGLTQNVTVLLAWSFLEAARYIESFKALVNKPPEELQSEAATASIQKDHFTLATDFLTSLRVVSRTDAATLLSRFGTIANIAKADKETLESCPGIGTVKAEKIYDALHSSFKRKNLD
ncbi:hypothetical protein Aperf_G00000084022 [Anoplocephala perfoliata]